MLRSERVWLLPKGNRGIWLRCISTGLHVYILHVQLPSEQHMTAVCSQFTDLACIMTPFALTSINII